MTNYHIDICWIGNIGLKSEGIQRPFAELETVLHNQLINTKILIIMTMNNHFKEFISDLMGVFTNTNLNYLQNEFTNTSL